MNLLSLVSPWLDKFYRITTKDSTVTFHLLFACEHRCGRDVEPAHLHENPASRSSLRDAESCYRRCGLVVAAWVHASWLCHLGTSVSSSVCKGRVAEFLRSWLLMKKSASETLGSMRKGPTRQLSKLLLHQFGSVYHLFTPSIRFIVSRTGN
jgi:hypothetical protein